MRVALLACVLAACGPRAPATPQPSAPKEPPPAERYTTETRAPSTPGEQQLAERGVLFDPALDCVARAIALRAPQLPNPADYRNRLPLRCGSPLYPVRAELVADDAALLAATERYERDQASTAPLVLGTAKASAGSVVVFARRIAELEPISRAGAATIAGRTHVPVDIKGKALISTARAFTVVPFEIAGGGFTVETGGPRDATIELVYVDGLANQPFARLELGGGSPLFRRDGSLINRINEARRVVGASPLSRREPVGTCDEKVPPQIDGIDVSDHARCLEAPLDDVDDLADEIAYRPLMQDVLLTPAASMIEIGASPPPAHMINVRVLKRFEAMTPDAARTRVLELLHARWPDLVERKAKGIEAVVDTWSHDPDVYNATKKYKPALDKIASAWTTTKLYYDGLTTGRDLESALALIKPEAEPIAADAAVLQVRGKDGAMLHAIAIVLELP